MSSRSTSTNELLQGVLASPAVQTPEARPRLRLRPRVVRRLAPVVVAAALVAGCGGGEEPVRSPLTVEDLGPGQWSGPLADADALEGPSPRSYCLSLGGFFVTGGHEIIDQQRAYFGAGGTTVDVRAERYAQGDRDLRERLRSAESVADCAIAEGETVGEVTAASFDELPSGVLLYEEHATVGEEVVIQLAVTTTEEWFVSVRVSSMEGVEAPEAVELLERAVANVEALPAPDNED